MEITSLLSLPEGLRIASSTSEEQGMTIRMCSVHLSACCPLCGEPSELVHSQYQRHLRDFPCGGQVLHLQITARKFFCQNTACSRKIFAERLAPLAKPWAQMTLRLVATLQVIGLATGGRLGVRLADRLGVETSRTTILRRIMDLPAKPARQVTQIGIDDFSFRRGKTFGTIIVDLQTHEVLDVLPDRTADTSATWMAEHPELEIISRDRGGDYAAAARTSAPQATQIADRFHLLKNLGTALQGTLARHLAAHRSTQAEKYVGMPLEDASSQQPPKQSPKEAHQSQAKREERLAQYKQVVALRKLGLSQTAIANRTGMSHSTVSRWLDDGTFPEQQPRPRKSYLDPYLPFLYERWEAGCHNITQLHQELVARGYKKSYKSVYKQLVRLLPEGRKNSLTPDPTPRPLVLPRQAVFLFLRRPTEEFSSEEQETLAHLCALHTEVNQAYELVQQFAQMLRNRTGEKLDAWLAQVKESHIRELQSFGAGIERDKAAVVAGLTLSQSNGLIEGKVNKLKLIKRMGYGRAGFALLRQRVLHAL